MKLNLIYIISPLYIAKHLKGDQNYELCKTHLHCSMRNSYTMLVCTSCTRAFRPYKVKPTTLVRLLHNLCWHLFVQVYEMAGQAIAM